MTSSHDHDPAHGDHSGHSHEPEIRNSGDQRRVLIAASLTGAFMIAEVIGGLLSGSLALIADAGHMLTDAFALTLAYLAFRFSQRPATAVHSYGLDRLKPLAAYTNGLAVFAIGIWIVVEAWHRLQEPGAILAGPMLIIAILGLVVNVVIFLILRSGDRDNVNMRGAILHVLGDLLGSVAAIVAALVIVATGWTPIDPILSAFVALILFRSAWTLVRQSSNMLLQGTPQGRRPKEIARDIEASVEGVEAIDHIHLWGLDDSRHVATLHVRLGAAAGVEQTIQAIRQRLADHHGIAHSTIEPEGPRHCSMSGHEPVAEGA